MLTEIAVIIDLGCIILISVQMEAVISWERENNNDDCNTCPNGSLEKL